MKNLADLQNECKALGLPVKQSGKRPAKEDYVHVLHDHFLKDYPGGKLPYEEIQPMLCFAYWNLKEAEQKVAWKSPSFIAQEKMNGCRLIVHFVKGVGTFVHSRTVSEKTYRVEDKTDRTLLDGFVPNFDATIDCEGMIDKPIDTTNYTPKGAVTKTSLHSTTSVLHLEPTAAKKIQVDQDCAIQFRVFDILKWEGRDLRNLPLRERLHLLQGFQGSLQETPVEEFFNFPTFQRENKEEFFNQIVAAGGEGVILKNLDGKYEDSSSRQRNNWIKVKKRIEFDAFVSGFLRGEPTTGWKNLIGALEFSVVLEDGKTRHVIGMASNIPMEVRQAMTNYNSLTDTVQLKIEWYGKVAEISGQDVSARVLRLSHCTLDRWRDQAGDEKTWDQCVVKMADLKQAAEWVG